MKKWTYAKIDSDEYIISEIVEGKEVELFSITTFCRSRDIAVHVVGLHNNNLKNIKSFVCKKCNWDYTVFDDGDEACPNCGFKADLA